MNRAAMFVNAFVLFVAATLSVGSPLQGNNSDAEIHLPTGRYIGDHDAKTSTTTYYAIPYASSSRFEASQLIDSDEDSTSVVNASAHGPACINFKLPPPYNQGFQYLFGDKPLQPASENCLMLDVYVPDGNYQDLPVLVFIPGGAFLQGASWPYDMRDMIERSAAIKKPFVGVVINYRLGPLGFLNPSIWSEERINLGLWDQVNALRWVQKYVSKFGGSPNKVTLMGESAGAQSTLHQLLGTDESLFQSAWIMSAPASGAPFLATKPTYKDDLIKSYAEACGCNPKNVEDAVSCLRSTPVSTLLKQSVAWEGSATSFGGIVKKNVFDAIRHGDFPRLPVVISICRDEGTAATVGFQSGNTKTTSLVIDDFIRGRGLQGQDAENFKREMLQAYPIDPALGCPFDSQNTTYNQPSQFKRMAAIYTDGTFTEAWLEFLETFSHKTNAWGIIFEQPLDGAPPARGVQHGSDLIYYFPNLVGRRGDPRLRGHESLVDAVFEAVINFVSDGDPNGHNSSARSIAKYHWPVFSEARMVTALNATQVTKAIPPPRRPGFEVLHRFLRPGSLWDEGH